MSGDDWIDITDISHDCRKFINRETEEIVKCYCSGSDPISNHIIPRKECPVHGWREYYNE